ncbi:MAG TPA: hypothetical protein V6C58_29130 [Allocoleopsis sp.]
MKNNLIFSGTILANLLLTNIPVNANSIKVQEFTLQQSTVGSGCSVIFFKPQHKNKNLFLFIYIIQGEMEMRLNGKMVKFKQVKEYTSNPKYYQADFISKDGKIKVKVNGKIGKKIGEEVTEIINGSLILKKGNQEVKFNVIGELGC